MQLQHLHCCDESIANNHWSADSVSLFIKWAKRKELFWHSCAVSIYILITHFCMTGTVESYSEIDLKYSTLLLWFADEFSLIITVNVVICYRFEDKIVKAVCIFWRCGKMFISEHWFEFSSLQKAVCWSTLCTLKCQSGQYLPWCSKIYGHWWALMWLCRKPFANHLWTNFIIISM